MTDRRAGPGPYLATRTAWAGRLALACVLLALIALVVAPALLLRRQAPLRRQAEAADEARTLVSRVQFALASQMSALRGAQLGPDLHYGALYTQALELERSAYPSLDSLAPSLLDPARTALVRLQDLSSEWHRRLDDRAVLRREPGSRGELQGRDLELYEATLRAARELDRQVAATALRRREAIRSAEASEDVLTRLMASAALLAAVVVGWFGHRLRLLARAAAEGRADAERAVAEMRRLGESRERLIRGVTHDLKNPLGAANGYTQLLQEGLEGPLASGQARMVESMRRCHGTMLALIEDLLDFSRAESGDLDLVVEPVDCGEVAREIAEEYQGVARAAGHELEVRVPEHPLPCATDPRRALRIVGNLLSNAVKYTPAPGRLVLEARAASPGAGPRAGEWVQVRVCDTGPGIPQDERERIFDEFHRLHGREVSGHGLGLATSRRIARLLGGEITVADAEGGGAAFTLWLPAEAGPHGAPGTDRARGRPGVQGAPPAGPAAPEGG